MTIVFVVMKTNHLGNGWEVVEILDSYAEAESYIKEKVSPNTYSYYKVEKVWS